MNKFIIGQSTDVVSLCATLVNDLHVYTDTGICQGAIVVDFGDHIIWDSQGFIIGIKCAGVPFLSNLPISLLITHGWMNYARLKTVNCRNAGLIGVMPTEIGKLSSLVTLLDFSYNSVRGTIPTEIAKLTQVSVLNLQKNLLSGELPQELGKMTALTHINVANNKHLSGVVPDLSQLVSLAYLNTSNTNLTFMSTIAPSRGKVNTIPSTTTISPTSSTNNLRQPDPLSQSTSGTTSTSGMIAGIVIGATLFIIILGALVYRYCMPNDFKKSKGELDTSSQPTQNYDCVPAVVVNTNSSKTKQSTNEYQMILQNENIPSFSWGDIIINNDDTNIVIGEGSFGRVVKAQLVAKKETGENITNDETVIKIMRRKGNFTHSTYDDGFKNAVKEVRVHLEAEQKILNKNCIVKVYGIVEGDLPEYLSSYLNTVRAVGIIMRYEAETLTSFFKSQYSTPPPAGAQAGHCSPHSNNNTDTDPSNSTGNNSTASCLTGTSVISITLKDKIYILLKIALGLADLHKAGVSHGDIKPDNILLSSKDLSKLEVRLADFGLAEMLARESVVVGESSLIETKRDRGTPIYCAPERLFDPYKMNGETTNVLKYAKPSEKTDSYSFAILTWEFLTEQKPFSWVTSQVELSVQVHQGVRPDINELPSDCPVAVRNMIISCWDQNRGTRKTALECSAILRQCCDEFNNEGTENVVLDV